MGKTQGTCRRTGSNRAELTVKVLYEVLTWIVAMAPEVSDNLPGPALNGHRHRRDAGSAGQDADTDRTGRSRNAAAAA